MRNNPQHMFVRLQLLQNANFGAASGKATLDRPTQVDAYLGLPFVPNSSFRGVLRNYWEWQEKPSMDSELVFGTRKPESEATGVQLGDRPKIDEITLPQENKPGQLIVGNGDLLAFPLLAADGRRCWVIPFVHLVKFITLDSAAGIDHKIDLALLAKLLKKSKNEPPRILGIPLCPPLGMSFDTQSLDPSNFEKLVSELKKLILCWCGSWLPLNEPWLIASDQVVEHFWNLAVEIRDQTALSQTKTARDQSLRRIETIPAGTMFLSWLSWFGDQDLALHSATIQIGSGEGSGNGFCRVSTLDMTPDKIFSNMALSASEPEPKEPIENDSEAMLYIYQQVEKARLNYQPRMRKKLRSAIRDWGWRYKSEGLEAALSFALAKAKPKQNKKNLMESDELQAYQWLLTTLLKVNGDLDQYHQQPWFSEEFSINEKINLLQRWQWLRKYSEIELIKDIKSQEVRTWSD